ncbi:outer membrane protein assembly factor BamB [Paraferrimonas sp. SM1919]|uniref:outer membrane protein assembly factor BamB n=1 Tax=Paraferrimonas sp. SM1919 TaxID=2662263 RepID=UPI0013CFB540|nr:outer membrane protein assembly factor BamB [Paraferrimonas sp. SM1919]
MKFRYFSRVALVAGLTMLAACSSTDDEEQKTAVAPLKKIEQRVELKEVWSASVGDGVENYFSRLRPAVNYGKIYVADRYGSIIAFDKKSKDIVWQQDFSEVFREHALAKNKGARISAGLTVARNKVFVGSERGLLVALEAKTGELAWEQLLKGELLSPPVVADNTVIVHAGSGTVYALNVDNGEELWRFEAQLPALTLRGTSEPIFEAGGVFVGGADGKVSVLVAANGQPAWEQSTLEVKGSNDLERMADIDSKPLIIRDTLYTIGYNGNLTALEIRSGRVKWQRQYSSFHNLESSYNRIFLVDDSDTIHAIDSENGLEVWSNSDFKNRQLTAAVRVGEYLLVGDLEGYLHVLATTDGSNVGRLRIDGSGIFSHPVVMDDQLLIQTRAGKIALVSIEK